MQVRAKKFLGQHFLKDLDIARQIAQSIPADVPTPVLEVGPGMGVLTQFLLENPNIDLTCIEVDHESVVYLKVHYPQLKLIEGDFLRLDLPALFPDKFCLIGNYPYNISSQILFKALENKDRIPVISGMFQKEVAERVASKPGNIRLTRNQVAHLDCDESLFKTVVKTAFNQRRKTMRNSLRALVGNNTEFLSDEVFNYRPEQLGVGQFVDLTNKIAAHLSSAPSV